MLKKTLPYLVLLILSIVILYPIFSPGFLTKSDSPVHIAEAEYLAQNVMKDHLWLNGWYPYEYAGFPIQMYYYQLGMLMVAALNLLGMNIVISYKIVLVLSLFLPTAALFFLLRKFTSSWIAFAIATAFLFQKDLSRLILAGMWANLITFSLFILLIKKLFDYQFIITKRRALILALLVAAIILGHPFFVVAVAATLILAYFFSSHLTNQPGKTFFNYALLTITASLLVLFYLYPFFDTSSWLTPESGWGLGKSLEEMFFNLLGIFFSLKPHLDAFNQLLVFNPSFFLEALKSLIFNLPMLLIDVLAILGVFHFLKEPQSQKKTFLWFILFYTFIFLIIGTGFWYLFPWGKSTAFLNGILAYRFVYYARLGLFAFAAYFLTTIIPKKQFQKYYKPMIAALIVLVLAGLLVKAYSPSSGYTQTFPQAQISQDTENLWEELKHYPKDEFRILNENFFDNIEEPWVTKDSILPAMAHSFTGQHFFGAWYTTVYPMEKKAPTENHKLFGKKLEDISGQEIQQHLQAYNIKYIIAVSPELKERFNTLPFLQQEKIFGQYTLYSYSIYTPSWISPQHPLEAELVEFSDQKIVFHVVNPKESQITIKFAYHPYWRAFANNKEIDLRTNEFYLMEADLPAGEYDLTLSYQPKNYPAIVISTTTFIMILVILKKRK